MHSVEKNEDLSEPRAEYQTVSGVHTKGDAPTLFGLVLSPYFLIDNYLINHACSPHTIRANYSRVCFVLFCVCIAGESSVRSRIVAHLLLPAPAHHVLCVLSNLARGRTTVARDQTNGAILATEWLPDRVSRQPSAQCIANQEESHAGAAQSNAHSASHQEVLDPFDASLGSGPAHHFDYFHHYGPIVVDHHHHSPSFHSFWIVDQHEQWRECMPATIGQHGWRRFDGQQLDSQRYAVRA